MYIFMYCGVHLLLSKRENSAKQLCTLKHESRNNISQSLLHKTKDMLHNLINVPSGWRHNYISIC